MITPEKPTANKELRTTSGTISEQNWRADGEGPFLKPGEQQAIVTLKSTQEAVNHCTFIECIEVLTFPSVDQFSYWKLNDQILDPIYIIQISQVTYESKTNRH